MTQNETIIFKDASGMVMQVLSCGNELARLTRPEVDK